MKIKPKYTNAIVIVHGKSEEQIVKYIKSNLKLKFEIYKDPNTSIQITDLNNILNNNIFKEKKKFIKYYEDIEWDKSKKQFVDFKIFIIMDTDDCTEAQKNSFMDSSMFREHWLSNYIVPIYNIRHLEEVMKSMGINVVDKKEYIKIFPTDRRYINGKNDLIQIEDLMKKAEICKRTNLDVFLKYCLKCTTSYKR